MVATALLAACGAPVEAVLTDESPATPALALGPAVADGEADGVKEAAGALVAADGRALPLRAWVPARGEPAAAVIALHGFNDYSAAFADSARAWAAGGTAVYAYDQRGFGANPNLGRWPGVDALVADARAALSALAARHPDVPRFALGESMGGAIVLAALGEPAPDGEADDTAALSAAAGESGSDPAAAVDGAVLVAPAVWARSTMPAVQRWTLWLADRLVPGLVLSGEGLGIDPTDNPETLRMLWEDPRVIKRNRVDALAGVVDAMDRGLAAAGAVDTPLLVLYGDREEVIPPQAVDALTARLDPDRHTVARYADGYHMLLRDLNGPVVRRDIGAWMADRTAPLPSGADAAWRDGPGTGPEGPGEAGGPGGA